jgi:hypothetical protein
VDAQALVPGEDFDVEMVFVADPFVRGKAVYPEDDRRVGVFEPDAHPARIQDALAG